MTEPPTEATSAVAPVADRAAESLTGLPASAAWRDELNRRVLYLMLFRLVLISLVLGVTIILSWLSDVDALSPASLVLFGIIGTTYLLSLIYAVAIRRGIDPMRLADGQVAADLITTCVLIHITGGAQSAYTFFFPLSIIGAATVRFRAGAVTAAAASVALFLAVSVLGWLEILPHLSGQRVLPSELTGVEFGRAVALNLAAFAGVAVLAYNLGAQIQRTAESLRSERTAAADLATLHGDIVRSLSSGLITVDREGRVLSINQAACDLLETTVLDAIGHRADRVMPGVAARIGDLLQRDSRRFDLTVERGDRSLILGVSTSSLRDNQNQIIGRVLSFQDLTELREMERQYQRAERMAVIGRLAAGVAHEIRNPLASISGSIELLAPARSESDDDRRLMEIINREIERLNQMISDLLDYSNPQPRKLIEFDLAVLVSETLQVFEQDRDFGDIEIALTEDSPREGLSVIADPAKLRQVLWNLLRNAAEAATEGGGHVVVRLGREDSNVVIEVKDDGPGLDAEHLERVFDPFFTTKTRGSGLGLATCQNIMTEHGGEILAAGDPGQGCTFTVVLPIPDPNAAAPAARE